MAYSTSSPPSLISQRLGSNGGALWWYASTDAPAVVRVTGYITDGDDLGMKVGDVVFGVDTDASPIAVQMYIVTSVAAGGAADLSDGTAITATDTD